MIPSIIAGLLLTAVLVFVAALLAGTGA